MGHLPAGSSPIELKHAGVDRARSHIDRSSRFFRETAEAGTSGCTRNSSQTPTRLKIPQPGPVSTYLADAGDRFGARQGAANAMWSFHIVATPDRAKAAPSPWLYQKRGYAPNGAMPCCSSLNGMTKLRSSRLAWPHLSRQRVDQICAVLTTPSVVLHCSRRICWMIKRAFERTKVAKFASDEAQTAARLDTSRGFVTKYEANYRHLLCR